MENIEMYMSENLPLIVPVTLINHYVRKYDEPYLKEQTYLHPHPTELKLLLTCFASRFVLSGNLAEIRPLFIFFICRMYDEV